MFRNMLFREPLQLRDILTIVGVIAAIIPSAFGILSSQQYFQVYPEYKVDVTSEIGTIQLEDVNVQNVGRIQAKNAEIIILSGDPISLENEFCLEGNIPNDTASTYKVKFEKISTNIPCELNFKSLPSQKIESIAILSNDHQVECIFQPLNPYNFDADIFKLERKEFWFYGISAKRYCLYTFENGRISIGDDDYSAHGLGHLLDPTKDESDEKSDWHKQIWYDILDYHYYDIELGSKYEEKYATQKISLATPSIWLRFSKFNKGKPYSEQIKPFNFVLVGFGNIEENGEIIKPLTPYQNPAKRAVYGDFIDCNTKSGKIMRGKEYWKNLSDTILEYLRHPESKFDGDIGILKTKEIIGLCRNHPKMIP